MEEGLGDDSDAGEFFGWRSYDEEDEVVVITSMPLEEDQEDLDEGASEDIQVVTGSSVPVNTWDELEVIEGDVNVSEDLTASIIEDICCNFRFCCCNENCIRDICNEIYSSLIYILK